MAHHNSPTWLVALALVWSCRFQPVSEMPPSPSDDTAPHSTNDSLVVDDTDSDPTHPADTDDDETASNGGYQSVGELPSFEVTTFKGDELGLWAPDDMVAMVFLFHGSNGNWDWFDTIEPTATLVELVDAGFGFASSESSNRSDKKWDISNLDDNQNDDLTRMRQLRDHLINTTDMTESTPIFALGFSNGGYFATMFGHYALSRGWPFLALSAHNAGPAQPVREDLSASSLFILAENDNSVNNAAIAEDYQNLVTAGRDVELLMSSEGPLMPLRFVRIPKVTTPESVAAFEDCVTLDIIDGDGHRLIDLADEEEVIENFKDYYVGPAQSQIAAQLRVVWTLHRFDGWWATHERDFFTSRL